MSYPAVKEYGIEVRFSQDSRSEIGRYWMWQSDS